MTRLLLVIASFAIAWNSFAQLKPNLKKAPGLTNQTTVVQSNPIGLSAEVPTGPLTFDGITDYRPIKFVKPNPVTAFLKAHYSEVTGLPYLIEGEIEISPMRSTESQVHEYLSMAFENSGSIININELIIDDIETEADLNYQHFRFRHEWQGIPVYGSEAVLHKLADKFYMFNGRLLPSPVLKDAVAVVTQDESIEIAQQYSNQLYNHVHLSKIEKEWIGGEQYESELIIFNETSLQGEEKLVWKVNLIPNLATRITLFIDAKTGKILRSQNELCQLVHNKSIVGSDGMLPTHIVEETNYGQATFADGPATAMAVDLFGQQRLINTYQKSGTYFMIDASRAMFKGAQSVMPDEPVGVIWTLDAKNKSPENTDFQATHVASLNNTWNDPKSVSAHYHGARAFEYFNSAFSRNSINGRGGNIISFINVVDGDGSQMDNAFWNGAAMFYGNGNKAFKAPLCKALDVAGHEMAHGVIQATSNLEYYGESGALNESFADVFGAMIDRDDWKMGEDIVHTGIFPTGALRDLSNPHNGGTSLNDPGYQPAHYNERYNGTEDNAGVHINSGIPNKAFQLFADNPAVGKSKAEQVYYRALTKYLVKSSRFIDCRIAVIQSATDLYGASVANAAAAAFDAVGIKAGTGTQTQKDVNKNPGNDFILMSDDKYSALYVFSPSGQAVANPLASIAPSSKPSITDDGSVIVFIAKDKTMRAITINWSNGQIKNQTIHSEPIWRNVAISKDGRRIAALTTDQDNKLYVFSYDTQKWTTFRLYNPTTGQGAPTTGDVLYADVLEWDFTGEWVMYDALNKIKTTGAKDIEYWDISFARVWNKQSNKAGDGFISKLFNGLPSDVSVGNPTFAKNSDYVIAFDYIDDFEDDYYLLSANLETGDVGTIFQNTDLSWPSFSVDDKRMVFDAEDTFGNPVLAFIPLGIDKISASGNASIFIEQGRWGVWFANGSRVLTNAEDVLSENHIKVFPNPAQDILNVQLSSKGLSDVRYHIIDILGRTQLSGTFPLSNGTNSFLIPIGELSTGIYSLVLDTGNQTNTMKILKN